MKILVADDDIVSRVILTKLLGKMGFDPVIAEDGKVAWAVLQQPDAPRLVLLDWNMPAPDGAEICRRIRKRATSDPPYIIMLSARDRADDIVEGFASGISDYIRKPFNRAELRARLMVGKRTLELQTRLILARDMLEHQAMHDALTDVFNRGAIEELLEREISRVNREGQSLNMGMYDIDHFKRINDKYGHQVGDEVLVGVVRRIQEHTRDYTAVGRYGGEEFIVLLSGPSDTLSDNVHERLCNAVAAQPFASSAGLIPVTISVGVAWANDGSSADAMIGAADKALYLAKQSGRNRVVKAEQ